MTGAYERVLSKHELRSLVYEWTLSLKADGVLPERTLVTVKTLVGEGVAREFASYAGTSTADDLTMLVDDAAQFCIDAYFDGTMVPDSRPKNNSIAHKSRSRKLLLKLLVLRPGLSSAAIGLQLSAEPRELAAFICGTQLMSLDVQERLANYVIEEEPALERLGRRLQVQVGAARRYEEGRVMGHLTSQSRMW